MERKDAKPYYDLVNSLEYLSGVREMFSYVNEKGYTSVIISASSIDVTRRVKNDYDVPYIFANELVIKDGKVSGEFHWPIGAGKENKAKIIRGLSSRLNISQNGIFYIGDSDTDIEAFKQVGTSIAFNSSSDTLKKVATFVVDSDNLADVIKYLP